MAALLAALTLAALLAAAGAWLGWRWAGPLPSDAQARETVAAVAAGSTVTRIERHGVVFGYDHGGDDGPVPFLLGSDDYNGGYVLLSLDASDGGFDALLGRVRDGLTRQGWQVGPEPWGPRLTAAKGDLVVTAYPVDGSTPLNYAEPGSDLGFEFGRAEPRAVPLLTLVGWLMGLAVGWLVAVRVIARSRGWRATAVLAQALGWIGLAMLQPATILSTGDVVYSWTALPNTVSPPATWSAYTFFGIRPLALLGAACLFITLTVATLSRPKDLSRQRQ